MNKLILQLCRGALVAAVAVGGIQGANAQNTYQDPGISDSQIKLGVNYTASGPAAAYGSIYEGTKAYFDLVNSRGGVNGRKIELVALDDAYQPTRSLSDRGVLNEFIWESGAGGDIGKVTAKAFANAGSKLALVDINQDALQKVAEELNLSEEDCLLLPANVANEEEVQNYVQKTKETFDRIDVFF